MADKNNSDKKQKRINKRDAKLEKYVTSEAKDLGVDLDSPNVGPLGAKEKAEIDTRISNYAKEDQREGLARLQKRYKNPGIETPTKLNKEDLKKQYKKQRRAKLWDVLGAVAGGLAGQSVDPSKFKFTQLKNERQNQLKQFKSASKASKQKLAEWGEGYAQDQIDYLEGLKSKETSPLKIRKMQAEINKINAETEATKALAKDRLRRNPSKNKSSYQLKKGEHLIEGTNPYSTILESLTPDTKSLYPKLSSGENKTPEMKNDDAREILLQMYDIKYDKDQNRYLAPKKGKEDYLNTAKTKVDNQNQIVKIIDDIAVAKEKLADMGDQGTSWYEATDKPIRERLIQRISDLKAQKEELENTPKTKLDEIYGL